MSRKLLPLIHCEFQMRVLRDFSLSFLEFSIYPLQNSYFVTFTACTSPQQLLNLSIEVPALFSLKEMLFQAYRISVTLWEVFLFFWVQLHEVSVSEGKDLVCSGVHIGVKYSLVPEENVGICSQPGN